MRINIKYKPKKENILVRRISWRTRCAEQLDRIIKRLENINKDLRRAVNG